jgi:hypothetical protein
MPFCTRTTLAAISHAGRPSGCDGCRAGVIIIARSVRRVPETGELNPKLGDLARVRLHLLEDWMEDCCPAHCPALRSRVLCRLARLDLSVQLIDLPLADSPLIVSAGQTGLKGLRPDSRCVRVSQRTRYGGSSSCSARPPRPVDHPGPSRLRSRRSLCWHGLGADERASVSRLVSPARPGDAVMSKGFRAGLRTMLSRYSRPRAASSADGQDH